MWDVSGEKSNELYFSETNGNILYIFILSCKFRKIIKSKNYFKFSSHSF